MQDDNFNNIQYLTKQGHDELLKEYVYLKEHKIKELANRIDEAKQHGDLSENAEYQQAKEDMAWAQGRMLELTQILDNAQVITGQGKTNTVSIGCTVKFRDNNGQTKKFTIVGPQEANPSDGKISNESPLGEAFIGRKVGDKIKVATPAGEQIYEILEIS